MSKTITIIKCEGCGKELIRKEEGEGWNPNGTYTINNQIMKVSYTRCPHCNPKEKKNEDIRR